MGRPRACLTAQPRALSRTERARAALAYLSRVMRPLTCRELAAALGLSVGQMHDAVYHDRRFSLAGGRYWITLAGWRERLAGHKDLRGG